MDTRNLVRIAFLSSLTTILLIAVIFIGVSTTLADNSTHQVVLSEPDGLINASSPGIRASAMATDSHLRIAGSGFNPFYSETNMQYDTNGCVFTNGETYNSVLTYPLTLPNNSIITNIYFFYKDTNATYNMTMSLHRYDYGNADYIENTLTSVGAPGLSYANAYGLNIILYYNAHSYSFVWSSLSDNGTDMELCGFEVFYIPPSIFGSALPLIAN